MDRETGPRPRFWWDERPGVAGALVGALLSPFGAGYASVMRARAAAFASGRASVFRPPAPCVSVGNVTVGGTGKTPCVRWIAERLIANGRRPIVLARGYGAHPPGSDVDEEGASLLRAVPGLVVDQRPGRRSGRGDWSEIAGDAAATLVLDDGFQKLVCARDLDVVLVDASRPFGNGRCLPAGPLREPATALARADLILLTRADLAGPAVVAALRERIARLAPGRRCLRARHAPARLIVSGADASSLRGRRVFLLSGVAHPRAFAATAAGLGAVVVGHDARRDHARFDAAILAAATRAAKTAGADLVLCTAKDLPKLEPFTGPGPGAGPGADADGPPLDALDVTLEFLDDPSPLVDALRALPRGRGRAS